MKLVAQIAAGVTLAILAVWFIAAMGTSHGHDASSTSSSDLPRCDDSAVTAATANNLAEWLNQKIVVHGNAGLRLNGTLIAQISASGSVGRIQDTEQCAANASIGFKDTAGTLYSAEPVSILFNVANESNGTPKITFDEASLLDGGGAYDATASLLVAEDQRERSAKP